MTTEVVDTEEAKAAFEIGDRVASITGSTIKHQISGVVADVLDNAGVHIYKVDWDVEEAFQYPDWVTEFDIEAVAREVTEEVTDGGAGD